MTTTPRPLPARTLSRLRHAARPDSWRTLSNVALADLRERGLFSEDTWSLTPAGRDALAASPVSKPRTVPTEARALCTGDRVRVYDDEVGTHLREVACTTVLFEAGRPHTVLVDWVGDDLPTSSYALQQVVDVVQWVRP